ncbi:hypothetical protein FHS10_005748 [Mucilaginibacter dorajii]|nr:hypothetical protein [Mucilaginibacter dorajii]
MITYKFVSDHVNNSLFTILHLKVNRLVESRKDAGAQSNSLFLLASWRLCAQTNSSFYLEYVKSYFPVFE